MSIEAISARYRRGKVVEQAQSWLGYNEYDGTHKLIINVYNSQKKLPRSYPVQYNDAWCATFVSAVSVKLGYEAFIPTECSCYYMIEHFKKLGAWVEDESMIPLPGDIIFYDWDDESKDYAVRDNKGDPEHVGIVERVDGNIITVIEGNYKNAVTRRTLEVNGRYIRGYAVPKYGTVVLTPIGGTPVETPEESTTPAPVRYKPTVKEWQLAAIADGFKFPLYGADGVWGAECESVAAVAIVKRRSTYMYPNLTKIVQRAVGVTVDGLFGVQSESATIEYQDDNGLYPDGIVGLKTWRHILGQ